MDSIPRKDVESCFELLERIIESGGPQPAEYPYLNELIAQIARMEHHRLIPVGSAYDWWKAVCETRLAGTVQHFVTSTPHGYHGDFEIIDKIYRQEVHHDPRLGAWDRFFHAQAAPAAVRNRKEYLQRLLNSHFKRQPGGVSVLNIGSGPGRDMLEWFEQNESAPVTFDCVDQDPRAIEWAAQVCTPHLDRIRFHCVNAFRFRVQSHYGLIWSAGLFDYLSDRLFIRLLRRLLGLVAPGGEVVLGNFGPANPNRAYMETLGGWRLIHRSEPELLQLAHAAGAPPGAVSIGREPEGVNLFLHIQLT